MCAGEALATLIINKINGKLKVCAVKAPGFGDNKTNIMHDLAIFTGGQVYNEEVGMNLEQNFDQSILGIAKKVPLFCIPLWYAMGKGNIVQGLQVHAHDSNTWSHVQFHNVKVKC